jgi:hypothetical protein
MCFFFPIFVFLLLLLLLILLFHLHRILHIYFTLKKCCYHHNWCVFYHGSSQTWQLKWKRINCPSTWQFGRCKTKQRSTRKIFLSIRSPQSARPKFMFHFVGWFPCPLLGLLSKLIFWKWNKPFISDIRKETRFFSCFQWTGRVRRRMLLYKMTHGMNIGSWEWLI